jgi:hypothetical protein
VRRFKGTINYDCKDVPDIISGSASTWKMMEELFTKALRVNYLGVPYSELRHILLKQRFVFSFFCRSFASVMD